MLRGHRDLSPPCSPFCGCWAPQIWGTRSHWVGAEALLSFSPRGAAAMKNPSRAWLRGESWGSPLGGGHIQTIQVLSAVFSRDISASQKDSSSPTALRMLGCGSTCPQEVFFGGGGVTAVSRVGGGGAPCPHKVQQDLRADPFLHSLGHRVGGVTPNH